jgi:hypothetical protein
MKTNLLFVLLFISHFSFAQVEINASSVNAELEVKSQTKGILLPRLNNTEVVTSPEEGLLIYNKASKSPAYHDGAKWSNLMMPMPVISDEDSLTYNLFLSLPDGEEMSLNSISGSASAGGGEGATFSVSKPKDKNTLLWYRKIYEGDGYVNGPEITMPMPGFPEPDLLINVYHRGDATPYFSYKFSDLSISSMSDGHSKNNPFTGENYTISAGYIGWKDWDTGETFAIRKGDKTIIPY